MLVGEPDGGIGDGGQRAQDTLDFHRMDFFSADVRALSRAAKEDQFLATVPLGGIGETPASRAGSDGGAGHDRTAVFQGDGYAGERFADGASGERGAAGAVVADAAGFGGAIEVMDFDAVALEEGSCGGGIQDGARRDRGAHGTEIGAGRKGGKDAKEGRDDGQHSDMVAANPLDDLAGDVIACGDESGPLEDERQDEVAQSIGVAERDDGEIAITGADAHGRDDLMAIGEKMFGVAGDRFGRAGAARGDFQAAAVGRSGGFFERVELAVEVEDVGSDRPGGVERALRGRGGIEGNGGQPGLLGGEEKGHPFEAVGDAEGDPFARVEGAEAFGAGEGLTG